MTGLPPGCPSGPEWELPWEALDQRYAWIQAMRGAPQSPQFHQEGDVWVHTRAVLEALIALPGWRALESDGRECVFWAALLHDVAKPVCTRVDDQGQISSRGHGPKGGILARRLLWRLGAPLRVREQVCHLVRDHLTPFFLLERDNAPRTVHALSQRVSLRELALVAEADARGRICDDQAQLVETVELFRELAQDECCFDQPYAFPSDYARFLYFHKPERSPHYAPHEADDQAQVVLVCGLPAAGKDRWIQAHLPDWPRVHLDALRVELGVDPAGPQGPLVAAARERARELLRARRSFVWNATAVSRQVRGHTIDLFADYGAQVKIVYLESDEETLTARNRARARPVPDQVVAKILDRWEVPDLTEACQVEWVET